MRAHHHLPSALPWVALAAALVVAAVPAAAQTLYRCGNEYSQTPCSKDAPPARLPSSAAPDSPAAPGGKDLCIAEASKALGFNEPQPGLFENVDKGSAQVIQYAGTPIAAKTYVLSNRGKVHGGLLVPEQSLLCHLSDDERRLLRLAPSNSRPKAGLR